MLQHAFTHYGKEVWLRATSPLEELDITGVTPEHFCFKYVTLNLYWLNDTTVVLHVFKQWGNAAYETLFFEFGEMHYGANRFDDSERQFRQISALKAVMKKRIKLYVWQLCVQWDINGNWLRRVHYRISNRSNNVFSFNGTKQDTMSFIETATDNHLTRMFNIGNFPNSEDYSASQKTYLDKNFSHHFYMSCSFELLLGAVKRTDFTLLTIDVQLNKSVSELVLKSKESSINVLRNKFNSLGVTSSDVTAGFIFAIESSGEKQKTCNYKALHVHIVGVFDLDKVSIKTLRSKLKTIATNDAASVVVKSEDGVKIIDPIFMVKNDDENITREPLLERRPITLGKIDYITKHINEQLEEGKSNWGTVGLRKELSLLKKQKYKQQRALDNTAKRLTKACKHLDEDALRAEFAARLEIDVSY